MPPLSQAMLRSMAVCVAGAARRALPHTHAPGAALCCSAAAARRTTIHNMPGGGWSSVPPVPEAALEAQFEAERHDQEGTLGSLLRCIDKEMDDEALRIDKEAPRLPQEWDIVHEEGSAVFTMRRVWREREEHTVRCQLSARDPSLDPECDVRGEHYPFTFTVKTLANGTVTEFAMDVVEGECVVDNIKVFDAAELAQMEGSAQAEFDRQTQWPGPNLDEAEEQVLDALQEFLLERQMDDPMAEFIAHYTAWVEQLEYERWLRELKTFVMA